MRPTYQTITTTGAQLMQPLELYGSNFQVTVSAAIISGTATYTVEFSTDDPYDPTVTMVWFPHPSLTSQTVNNISNIAFPVRAVRINVATNTGSIRFGILQASHP
jgi:hypothetical protein